MNDIAATIGLENFKHVEQEVIKKQQDNAEFYNTALKECNITFLENKEDRKSAYWLYTIKVKNRDNFIKALKDKGITASRVHERNDKHTCTSQFMVQLPNLEKVVKELIEIRMAGGGLKKEVMIGKDETRVIKLKGADVISSKMKSLDDYV